MRKGSLGKRKQRLLTLQILLRFYSFLRRLPLGNAVRVPLSFYHTVKYTLRVYGDYGTRLCVQFTPSKVPMGLRKMFKKEIRAGGATKNMSEQS